MNNHRYEQVLRPIDRYVASLTPGGRRLVSVCEGGLLLMLLLSVCFYFG